MDHPSLPPEPACEQRDRVRLRRPLLLLLTFGIIGFGYVFGVYRGIQQLAAEAARSSVVGLDDAEREQIARDFVAAHAASYAFIDATRVRVTTNHGGPSQQSFEVAVAYDMSGSLYDRLAMLVRIPQPTIERRAAIQRGGH